MELIRCDRCGTVSSHLDRMYRFQMLDAHWVDRDLTIKIDNPDGTFRIINPKHICESCREDLKMWFTNLN